MHQPSAFSTKILVSESICPVQNHKANFQSTMNEHIFRIPVIIMVFYTREAASTPGHWKWLVSRFQVCIYHSVLLEAGRKVNRNMSCLMYRCSPRRWLLIILWTRTTMEVHHLVLKFLNLRA